MMINLRKDWREEREQAIPTSARRALKAVYLWQYVAHPWTMWGRGVPIFSAKIHIQLIVSPPYWFVRVSGSSISVQFSSVQLSRSVLSDSLRAHESQHTRPPCPSPTPRVYSNSCPLSRWCHPAISSSVIPFSSCPQSLPASGSFPMSHLFAWGSQSIGVSASASVLPMNT